MMLFIFCKKLKNIWFRLGLCAPKIFLLSSTTTVLPMIVNNFVWCILKHNAMLHIMTLGKIDLLIYIFAWVTILSYFRQHSGLGLIFTLLLIPFNFCNNNNSFTSLIRTTQRANFRQY